MAKIKLITKPGIELVPVAAPGIIYQFLFGQPKPELRYTPFKISGWPFPMGSVVDSLEIEGFTLIGVSAFVRQGMVFTCRASHVLMNGIDLADGLLNVNNRSVHGAGSKYSVSRGVLHVDGVAVPVPGSDADVDEGHND